MIPTTGIRLYAKTRYAGREHAEGPYTFSDVGSALEWLSRQTVQILSVSIYDGEGLLAEVHA